MTPRPLLAACALALAATPAPPARAQSAELADAAACTAIKTDAERLACYDHALHRAPDDTRAADEQAMAARKRLEQARLAGEATDELTLRERARQRLGALFRVDDQGAAEALANAGKGSLLDSRWELAKDSKLGILQLRAYKPVYLLPAFWTSKVNDTPTSPNPRNQVTTPQGLQDTETKFQLSFKTKFAEDLFGDNGDLWAAYTQSSRWQILNADISRPFRETNYEPEVMLVFRNGYSLGGWKGRMAGISLNHQSNGRADPLSRSWNRVIASFGLDRDNWALVVRPWWRVPEGRGDDDNPDIADYLGRGDAMLTWTRDGHVATVLARHSLRGGDRSHGALQLDYGFPISRSFRAHAQLFHGYGESMIDYNHKATYFGVGVSLLDWY